MVSYSILWHMGHIQPSTYFCKVLLKHSHIYSNILYGTLNYKWKVKKIQQRSYGLYNLKYLLSGHYRKKCANPLSEPRSLLNC